MSLHIPPPLQALFWAALMWGATRVLPDLNYSFTGQSLLAAVSAGTGIIIAAISVGAFVKAKTTVHPIKLHKSSTLVTNGLYKISRNPMYLAMLLFLLGWFVFLGNPLTFFGVVGFLWVMNIIQIKPEEVALETLFGAEYIAYKNRVRRWL